MMIRDSVEARWEETTEFLEEQRRSLMVPESVEPSWTRSDFRPYLMLGNPHVQTLLAFVLGNPVFVPPTQERRLTLPDGDQMVLHDSVPLRWKRGQTIAVIIHGLGGSHRSAHVIRQSLALYRRGLRVVRVDLRGGGRGIALARRTYHAGCSEDVRLVLHEVHAWAPDSPIILLGQSLGGNVVLKTAGEAAEDPIPGLARVIAVAPPIDLGACSTLLLQPHNAFYDQFFVRSLVGHLQRRKRLIPDLPLPLFPARITVRLFDEIYTAPMVACAGADDYYRRHSSFPLIPEIRVPTLVLTARDDPFIAVEPFERLRVPRHIEVRVADRGGHLGFLGPDGAGGTRWAERFVAEWAARGN